MPEWHVLKKNWKWLLPISLAWLVFLCHLFSTPAHAAVTVHQDYDGNKTDYYAFGFCQPLGTIVNASSSLQNIKIKVYNDVATSTVITPTPYFYENSVDNGCNTNIGMINLWQGTSDFVTTGFDPSQVGEQTITITPSHWITVTPNVGLDNRYYKISLQLSGYYGAGSGSQVKGIGSINPASYVSPFGAPYGGGGTGDSFFQPPTPATATTSVKDLAFEVNINTDEAITPSVPDAQILNYNPVEFSGIYDNPTGRVLGLEFTLSKYTDSSYASTTFFFNSYFATTTSGFSLPYKYYITVPETGYWAYTAKLIGMIPPILAESNFLTFQLLNTATTTGSMLPSNMYEFAEPPSNCSFSDIPACFTQLIGYLFVPSNSVLVQYLDVYNTIQKKPPVGYFTALQDVFNFSTTSAATTTTILNDNFIVGLSNFFNPIKLGLTILMWLFLTIFLFKRLTKLEL